MTTQTTKTSGMPLSLADVNNDNDIDDVFCDPCVAVIPANLQMCCFLGFVCILCSSVLFYNFRACFYNTLVIFAFICTLFVLLARLFQLWQRKFYKLNAIKYEFYLHTFLAFTCFLAGCVSISLDVLAYTIATFFAFLAFSFYTFDAYLGYRLNRQCDAQTQTQPQSV